MIKKQVYKPLADLIGETLKRDLSDIPEKGKNPITFEFSVLATWLVVNDYIPEDQVEKKLRFAEYHLDKAKGYRTLFETMVRFRYLKEVQKLPLWHAELMSAMYYLEENGIIGHHELGKILEDFLKHEKNGVMEA